MKKTSVKFSVWPSISLATLMTVLSGCGGGSSASDTNNTTNTGGGTTTITNTSGETLSAQVTGIAVPSEISAVPASNTSSSVTASFKVLLSKLAKATAVSELSATSDYVKAQPSVYVEERALEQFDIIEQVFGALAQTHYAEEENVNAGPYMAMIAWEENENGKDIKQLQKWVVESRMIVMENLPSDVTGNTTGDVNKLLAWIPERDRATGKESLIKAEFLIYTAPTTADDGSLLDYGEWDMNVLMDASGEGTDTIPASGATNFFAASARIGSGGSSTLKVHDRFTESLDEMGAMTLSDEMRGILVRSGSEGYGKVSYPDWEACFRGGPGGDGGTGGDTGASGGDAGTGGDPGMGASSGNPCENGIPTNVAQYAYNTNYLGVQEINDGTNSDPVYKDRNLDGAIRVVHKYDLFYADSNADQGITAGDNVLKHHSFGFPVTFTATASDNSGTEFEAFAFYGAWQGRHQLWGPGDAITATTDGSDGTTLTRADVRPGETAATYKLKEFNGTFTKRALVNASLDDIRGLPVETWLNDHYELFYFSDYNKDTNTADAGWYYCDGEMDWGNFSPSGIGDMMSQPPEPQCRARGANGSVIDMTPLEGSSLLSDLSVGEKERRWVNIDSCSPENGCSQYVYLVDDPGISGFTFAGAGFYSADWGERGLVAQSPANKLVGEDGSHVAVNMGGSVYVAYVGASTSTNTGWVVKELTGFDESTWTPTFSTTGDREFTPDRGIQYYMNANGQNYVVTRTGEDATQVASYQAQLELQIAANPANTSASRSILPEGTSYLAMPWDKTVKLSLVEDPEDSNYLLLVVKSDSSNSLTAGEVYTEDSWGLSAYDDSDSPLDVDGNALTADEWGWVNPESNNGQQPVQFNYEYSGNDGNSWGKQQFLVNVTDSTLGDFVILSDPISLVNVSLVNNLGQAISGSVNLQYDGWMHGLPELYHELERNGWSIEGLGEKVRRLTEGQLVADSEGTNYFVKPMETSLFLGVVEAFPNGTKPDLSQADAVDLSTVPDYTHHGMGATPTTNAEGGPIEVKYSEGIPLAGAAAQ